MTNRKTSLSVLAMILTLISTGVFMPRLIGAGDMEPSDSPGSTMKTLDEIPPTWSQKLQCDETACPRFELVMDGYAVLDKETGLVWVKEADLTGGSLWGQARKVCFSIGVGGRKGWRLPRAEELASLLDPQQTGELKLPSGHPFTNVSDVGYWSISYYAEYTPIAYMVHFYTGLTYTRSTETNQYRVWCVRGGR